MEENNYSANKKVVEKKVKSIEELNGVNAIKEKVNDNFSIDAEVRVNVSKDFSEYTAKSKDIDFDVWTKLFEGEKKIKECYDEDKKELINIYEDESFSTKIENLIGQYSYEFCSKECTDRELERFYIGSNDYNGRINYERDSIFKRKELGFMSSDKACDLVKNKLKEVGIETEHYNIYTVDYKYISEKSSEWGANGVKDDEENLEYTSNDEFYIIIPEIYLPNDGKVAELFYTWRDDGFSEVDSSMVYAIVGKNGILRVECSGLFEVIDEDDSIDRIVDEYSAWETMKSYYKDVVLNETLLVNGMELSYVPYIINGEEGKVKLKPTWIFSIIKQYDDGTQTKCLRMVDATTGNMLLQANEEAF